MSEFIEICEQAARAGGSVLRDWQDRAEATEKGPRDLVTEADLESQAAIRDVLLGAFPDHHFLGEEDPSSNTRASYSRGESGGNSDGTHPQYRWIVDPLDGTTNYVHHLQTFAVSVALERAGQLLVGVIYDPVADECFSAVAGDGAYLNRRPIRSSSCPRIDEALISASFSPNVQRGSPEVARFVEVLHSCQSLRRLGSAALNLCYVAAGRLDAYWATSLKSWDVAAGVLMVREAGGIVTHVDGGPFDLDCASVAASANRDLHDQFLRVLARGVI